MYRNAPAHQITFKKQATNETVKKCYKPMVQMCDGEPAGSREFDPSDPDVICKTVFESECTTRYRLGEKCHKLLLKWTQKQL